MLPAALARLQKADAQYLVSFRTYSLALFVLYRLQLVAATHDAIAMPMWL